jgi:hypothetical protein
MNLVYKFLIRARLCLDFKLIYFLSKLAQHKKSFQEPFYYLIYDLIDG